MNETQVYAQSASAHPEKSKKVVYHMVYPESFRHKTIRGPSGIDLYFQLSTAQTESHSVIQNDNIPTKLPAVMPSSADFG